MAAAKELFAFIHPQFVPLDKAFLHISDLSIQRGYGIFDFLKISNGHPLFLNDYLDRFYRSAEIMQLSIPYQPGPLKEIILELIKRNELGDSGLKMILTGGYSPDGYNLSEPNLIITQQALSLPDQALLERGIKIITHEYVREIPAAKTINYTMGIRLINKVKEESADDVLYHRSGVVTEFPRCNFFMVKPDNTIVTPAQDILLGVTRKHVLDLAGKKYKTEEGVITLNDIYQAKEAFLTSTTKRILPIVQVDDKIIGNGKPGAVTLSLYNDLVALEEKDIRAANNI